jgi:hypothetical protein
MSKRILDLVAAHDYLAFVQLCHMILRNCPLDESRYLEYSCHIAEEFAQGRRKRLIVNMPPGFAKTTIFSICGIAWLFAKDPTLRIMLARPGQYQDGQPLSTNWHSKSCWVNSKYLAVALVDKLTRFGKIRHAQNILLSLR